MKRKEEGPKGPVGTRPCYTFFRHPHPSLADPVCRVVGARAAPLALVDFVWLPEASVPWSKLANCVPALWVTLPMLDYERILTKLGFIIIQGDPRKWTWLETRECEEEHAAMREYESERGHHASSRGERKW